MNPQDEALSVTQELKPCPFCGSPARVSLAVRDDPIRHAIGCSKCLIMTEWMADQAEAITAWNTRLSHTTPGDAEVRGALEKLLYAMKRAAEMSANIMRDAKRTGGWEGADKTARAFERLSLDAANAQTILSSLSTPSGQSGDAEVRKAASIDRDIVIDLDMRRARVLAQLGLMLADLIDKKAQVDGFDINELFAGVIMALGVEEAAHDDDVGALQDVADHPEEHLLSDHLATPSGRAQGEWRPIETAPKDQNILIAAGGYVGEAYRREEGDEGDGWWWANTSWGDYAVEPVVTHCGEPTHWQPLPAAPPAQDQTKGVDHG